MFKSTDEFKQVLVPVALAAMMIYGAVTGGEYTRDIVVAFIAVLTNNSITNK